MGIGSPERLRRTLCLSVIALFASAAPAYAGDLLSTPSAPADVGTPAAVVPAAVETAGKTLVQAPAPAPLVDPATKPDTLPKQVVDGASAPLADTPASSLRQQLSTSVPRLAAATGVAATHVLSPKRPQTASAPAATPRRAGAPLPWRTASTRHAGVTQVANAHLPAAVPDTRAHAAVAFPSFLEPTSGRTLGGLAAGASGVAAGAVAALLAITILLGLLQVSARRMPTVVRPHEVLSALLLERPG